MKKLALSLSLALVACSKDKPAEPAKPAEVVKPAEPAKPVETATKTAEPAKPAEQPAAVAGKTGVTGTIKYEGPGVVARPVDMSRDKSCLKQNPKPETFDIKTKDGKLAEVLVYVKSGLPADFKSTPKTEPVVLDQHGCQYTPTVFGIQVGQPLVVKNSDPLLHNVHAYLKGGDFNQAMPKPGQIEKKIKKAQVPFTVKCDVHPWMEAHAGAFDHPFFAVSDEAGVYAIEGLPAGSYELEMYHPKLGTQVASVTVKDGAASVADATFKAAK